MRITIYHNPKCSNSRRCLEIIREQGYDPTIVEYLRYPPSEEELEKLVGQMGCAARDILRTREMAYAELHLDGAEDGEMFRAIAAHPVLLNRPIVVSDKGAKL